MKKMSMTTKAAILAITITLGMFFGLFVLGTITQDKPIEPIPVETVMTVDDVLEVAGTDYFIVKDVNTWAVLEDDVYMDREVVEINICDDVENTLCIFIELAEDETPRIRNN